MPVECIPISILPGTSPLFRDFAEAEGAARASLTRWFPHDPFKVAWSASAPELDATHRDRLADALLAQADSFGANDLTRSNIQKLRNGAAAVVSGQQVGLFGGPLLPLLKAATAIRKAQQATEASGRQHVPIFWLASEDHDLAEVDQAALLSKSAVETLTLGLKPARPVPVGALATDGGTDEGRARLEAELDRASELLAWAPIAETLRETYTDVTLALGFGKLLTRIFADFGLIVMDAATREFHSLGAPALRFAIEQAAELEVALLARSKELEAAGYHAQVLVTAGHSLLFLIDAETGARLPLRRTADGVWKAGAHELSTAALLAVLDATPERLSPNALLRPVFQDTILPTSAYIGGPAEIAYFAQSAVLYERILRRVTPVLPRLSATLVEPAIAEVMARHEVSLPQIFEAKTPEELALRLGARSMPIEGKRRIAAVGNALEGELAALLSYMESLSPDLGRSAGVSASKMRYQMARLRRMAARFETQKEASLLKHAKAMMLSLFPEGHLQERLLAGVWFLARYGDSLPALLVEHAGQECPGHRVLYL